MLAMGKNTCMTVWTQGGTLLTADWPLGHQPFTRGMAQERGVSVAILRRLLDAGLIRRMFHGAYVATQTTDSIQLRAAALKLVVPPYAVVTDRAAGWLHGMPVLRRGAHLSPPDIEVCQMIDSRMVRRGVDGHRRGLLPDDIEMVHGVRVTTPLRTALDLGRMLWRYDALAALDAVLRIGVDHEKLLDEIARFRGYRGVIQLRTLAPLADPRAESPGESALRLHWYDAGLPRPDLQLWVDDDAGVPIYRLDVPCAEVRFATEYDGEEFHSTAADLEHDEVRREWLRVQRRWTIVPTGKGDVYGPKSDLPDRLSHGFRDARKRTSFWIP